MLPKKQWESMKIIKNVLSLGRLKTDSNKIHVKTCLRKYLRRIFATKNQKSYTNYYFVYLIGLNWHQKCFNDFFCENE